MTDKFRTTYLFVSSRNAGDDPSKFALHVPSNSMVCKQDQYLRLTFSSMSILNQIPNVTPDNNKITVSYNNGKSEPGLALTSNIYRGYTASATTNPDYAYLAFDQNPDTYWASNESFDKANGNFVGNIAVSTSVGILYGEHCSIALDIPTKILGFEFTCNASFPAAKTWSILGQKPGDTTWYHLVSGVNNIVHTVTGLITDNSEFSELRVLLRAVVPQGISGSTACTLESVTFHAYPTSDEIWIDPGFHRVPDFATNLNILAVIPFSLQYSSRKNKYMYTNNGRDTIQISFQEKLADFVGDNVVTLQAFESKLATNPVEAHRVRDLVIHLPSVQVDPPSNLSNFESSRINNSQIFAVVPLRAAPGCLNAWSNKNLSYSQDVYDTNIQLLEFQVSDVSGKSIYGLPHWTAVLKVEILQRPERDRHVDRLDRLISLVKMMYVAHQLSMNKDNQDVDGDGDLEEDLDDEDY
jgi:hypothetical protein